MQEANRSRLGFRTRTAANGPRRPTTSPVSSGVQTRCARSGFSHTFTGVGRSRIFGVAEVASRGHDGGRSAWFDIHARPTGASRRGRHEGPRCHHEPARKRRELVKPETLKGSFGVSPRFSCRFGNTGLRKERAGANKAASPKGGKATWQVLQGNGTLRAAAA